MPAASRVASIGEISTVARKTPVGKHALAAVIMAAARDFQELLVSIRTVRAGRVTMLWSCFRF